MSTEQETKFINAVAGEMAAAVCQAVGYWIADIDAILANDSHSLQQKLDEIAWIVSEYKAVSHNPNLRPRSAAWKPDAAPADVRCC